MAADSEGARDLINSHSQLIEAELRSPPDPGGVWLVRPDGYVAAAAHAGDWAPIEDCFARLASGGSVRFAARRLTRRLPVGVRAMRALWIST